MNFKNRFLRIAVIASAFALLSLSLAYGFPSKTVHPNDRDSIEWEQDGTKDGSSPHNHQSLRSFGSWDSWSREPYTSAACWDNRTYRYDLAGTFDKGHCFIDEAAGSEKIPKYFFVGSGWPAGAQERIRDAFARWSDVASDDDALLTGIAFEEAASRADADIEIFWVDQDGDSGGGSWNFGTRELRFDNSLTWYFEIDPMEGQPDGIQNGEWHFFSVALHEVGHAAGLHHQEDGDLMDPTVGQPPEVPGHRYFVAPDVDSIAGIRDLYSQPHRRISFVIDDTGSMSQEIGLVKTTVSQKVDEFVAEDLLLRYHLLTYKDDVDYRGSTTDSEEIKDQVDALIASGGGDCPEEMLGALDEIAMQAPHSDAWVMTDAGFHGGLGDLANTIFNLVSARVRVHPIIYSLCFEGGAAAEGQRSDTAMDAGFGTRGSGLGPESLAQLADETGGHYFPISTAETQAAASILLNEMVTTADIDRFSDTVSGTPKVYEVFVEGSSEEANFLLNAFDGSVTLALEDPSGVTVGGGDPGVTYTAISGAEYYQVDDPLAGLWRVEVSGSGSFALSVSGRSPISFEYLSDTSLPLGEEVVLRASLTGSIEDPVFTLTEPDGTPVETLDLFDDGLHGDGSAGDEVYGGSYTATAVGSYRLRVEGIATDPSGHTSFQRTAPEVIRVQPLAVEGDGNRLVNRGETLVHRFRIENLGRDTDTFDLTASSDRGWADLGEVPEEVTIGAGAFAEIEVPVAVPADAEPGSVDEIVLVAISQTDLFVSDAGSAFTTMRTLLVAAEP